MAVNRMFPAVLALSAAGFVALLAHEGYTDRAVIPVSGDVPTIGHGTTTRSDGSPVQLGDRTTPQEAAARALMDVQRFEGALRECVRVPLSPGEYDVYVRFAYNVGQTAFCGSTLVKKLNAGDYAGACDQLKRWRFVAGRDCSASGSGCAGLWRRRLEEYDECMVSAQ